MNNAEIALNNFSVECTTSIVYILNILTSSSYNVPNNENKNNLARENIKITISNNLLSIYSDGIFFLYNFFLLKKIIFTHCKNAVHAENEPRCVGKYFNRYYTMEHT